MPRLRDLRVDLISLVDRAAVRDPFNKREPRRYVLFKRDGEGAPDEKGDPMSLTEVLKADAPRDEEERQRDEEREDEEEREEREPRRRARKRSLFKARRMRDEEEDDEEEDEEDLEDEDEDEDEDSDRDAGMEAEKAERIRARLVKAEAERRRLEALAKKAAREAQEAAELAKAERDRRELAEFVVKAESFEGLAADPHELGAFLKRAHERLAAEDFAYLQSLLKSADAAAEMGGAFVEVGRSGRPPAPQSARDELAKRAEEVSKAEGISYSQALIKVLRADSDLSRRVRNS
jgi:hypothetical protein